MSWLRWLHLLRERVYAGKTSSPRYKRPRLFELEERRAPASATLIRDINPGAASGLSTSTRLVDMGGTTYFTADDGRNGIELWRSDGTTAGTYLVRNVRPGSTSGFPVASPQIVDGNGTLYFSADDGANGSELWRSDGSWAGTALVQDINPGVLVDPRASSPSSLTRVGGSAFFAATSLNTGRELWKTDGTTGGTTLVKDIYAGSFGSSNPTDLTDVNGTLYFVATDGATGRELWCSDGTAAGTRLVKDIAAGSGDSAPTSLTAVGGTLYFIANDGTGLKLWKSDGTAAGTTSLAPGAYFSASNPTRVNDRLFFTARTGATGTDLWVTDGTTAGTSMVKDLYSGTFDTSLPGGLTAFNGLLYFSADDSAAGRELWVSDGTAAGTRIVADIYPGQTSSTPNASAPGSMTDVGGTLYFTAVTAANGRELWKTDGTADGTVLVTDVVPGATGSNPTGLLNTGGTLFFTATDGASGTELWAVRPDAPLPRVTINDVTRAEGQSGTMTFDFTVSLSAASNSEVAVDYQTVAGSAGGGVDFVAVPPTRLTFAPGQTTRTVQVTVNSDTLLEGDEQFLVALSNPQSATVARSAGVGTIRNDDGLWISDATVAEGHNGASTLTFTVTHSVPPSGNVTVSYSTSTAVGTAALSDYTSASGTLTFTPGGPTTQNIVVTVSGDRVAEDDETVLVTLSNASGATITRATGEGTIRNDDDPWITVSNVTQRELDGGTSPFAFTVTRSADLPYPITLSYATADGTATAGEDYTAAAGSLVVSPDGPATQVIEVFVKGDTSVEASEHLALDLNNPLTGIGVSARGVAVVQNDDTAVSVDDVTLVEPPTGTAYWEFTVRLAAATALPVSVNYATADDTATAGADYLAAAGTLTFSPGGPLFQRITVPVKADATGEATERFFLDLSGPTNATLARPRGAGTILQSHPSSWPSLLGDPQNTGRSQLPGPARTPEVMWEKAVEGTPASVALGPDGTLYVPTGFTLSDPNLSPGWLYALNPDGTQKWRRQLAGQPESTTPAIAPDGTIYIATERYQHSNRLEAIDPQGNLKWSFDYEFGTANWPVSSPQLGVDGTIYVGSVGGDFYALRPDGSLRWGGRPSGSSVKGTPAVAPDGTVYVHDASGIFAFDPAGGLKWSHQYAVTSNENGSVTVGPDGAVYVYQQGTRTLYGYNPDGSTRWTRSFDTFDQIQTQSVGADGSLLVLGEKGDLRALDPVTGAIRWQVDGPGYSMEPLGVTVGAGGTIYWRSPVAGAERVSKSVLRATNPDGTSRWVVDSPWPTSLSGGMPAPLPLPVVGPDKTLYVLEGQRTGSGANDYGFFVRGYRHIDDVTPPTVAMTAVSPDPRATAVSAMRIVFSEAVGGFDLADLNLTRDAVGVPLTGATLATTDNRTWTLGNLAPLTAAGGTYALTLTAPGSGIIDAEDNPLAAGVSETWVMAPPPAGPLTSAAFNYDYAADPLGRVITVQFDEELGVSAPWDRFRFDVNATRPLMRDGSAAVGDVNGDGIDDMVVSDFDGSVTFYPGLPGGESYFGRGSYLRYATSSPTDDPYHSSINAGQWNGVAIGDLNGDGTKELIIGSDVYSLTGSPDHSRLEKLYSFGAWIDASPAVGDLNGDGKPDVVITLPATVSAARIFWNTSANGTINFSPAQTLTTWNTSGAEAGSAGNNLLSIADLNGDGLLDLASPDGIYYNAGTAAIMSFNFNTRVAWNKSGGPAWHGNRLSFKDGNGDGLLDIYASFFTYQGANTTVHQVVYYQNTGTAQSPAFQYQGPVTVAGTPADLYYLGKQAPSFSGGRATLSEADLDGNGQPDLTAFGRGDLGTSTTTTLWGIPGAGGITEFAFQDTYAYPALPGVSSPPSDALIKPPVAVGVWADANGDGLKDLFGLAPKITSPLSELRLYLRSGGVPYMLADGTTVTTTTGAPIEGIGLCLVDVDLDGNLDIVTGAADGRLMYFRNTARNGGYAFADSLPLTDASGTPILAGENSWPTAIDLNGDGALDFLVSGQDGLIRRVICQTPGSRAGYVLDGLLGTDDQQPLELNNSVGGSLLSPALATTDIDHDGKPDVVLGDAHGRVWLLMNIGTGGAASFTLQPLQLTRTAAADMEVIDSHTVRLYFSIPVREDAVISFRDVQTGEGAVTGKAAYDHAPVITGITSDTGTTGGDGITTDRTLVISGKGRANSTVTLSRNGAVIGTTTANASGFWTFDHTATALADGPYAFRASSTGPGGNATVSVAYYVVVDNAAPAAPAVTAISTDTGASGGDGITTDRTLLISGTAEAGSTVTLLKNGTSVGTAVSNASGEWTFNHSGTTLAAGSYTFTARATDPAGNISPDSTAFAVVVDLTAPTVTGITPNLQNGIITWADVTFSEPIDLSTFGAEDLVLTRDGAAVPLGGGVTTALVSGNTYRISGLPAAASALGAYVLTVNAVGIRDLAGNSGAGSASGSWVQETTAPIASITAVSPDPRNTAVSSLVISFTEAVTGFNLADLSLTRDAVAVPLSGTTLTTSNNRDWTLGNLTGLTATEGAYALTLTAAGSGIQDLAGNPLTANASDSWVMDLTGPTILDVIDISPDPRNNALTAVDVVFSEPIRLTDLTSSRVTLTRNGSSVTVFSLAASLVSGTTYRLSGWTTETSPSGSYVLTVNANLRDLAGNFGSGSASDLWVTDTTALTADVVNVTPDPRATPVAGVAVTFNKAVTGFDLADLSLTRDGVAVPLTGATLATTDDRNWTLGNLSGLTAADGAYVLTVTGPGSGIRDVAGNTLAANVSDAWVTDATGPSVLDVVDVTPDPRNTSVATVDVVLSEPVNLSTFTFADLTLTRNGSPVALNSFVTVGLVSGNTYRISGLGNFNLTGGAYSLSVGGAGIVDAAGNAGSGTASDDWLLDQVRPTAAFSAVTPNPRTTRVAGLTITFSEPVTGFDLADLSLTRDAAALPLNGVTLTTADALSWNLTGLGGLTAADGSYVLTLTAGGSGIADAATNAMTANASATWTVDTTLPSLLDVVDVSPDPRTTSVSAIDVTFSKAINLSTFTSADITLTRNGSVVSTGSFLTVSSLGGGSYRISGLSSFTSQNGAYVLTVTGAGIQDALGNVVSGTVSDTWVYDTVAPTASIAGVTPNPRNSAVTSVAVTFSEAVTGFDLADISLTRDGSGVSLAGATLTTSDNTVWTLGNLNAPTGAAGSYTLKLTASGSGIQDAVGNALALNATSTWSVETTLPSITDVVDVSPDPRTTSVATVDVVFSEPINLATFTFGDLTLTRDGTTVPLTGAVTIALQTGSTFRISGLGAFTAEEGLYVLTVNASGIQDPAGNAGTGSASDTWALTIPHPTVTDVVDVTPDPRGTSVATVDVVFSEPISLATFTFADLGLTRDGAPVTLTGAVTTSLVSGATYRISGLSSFTAVEGVTYILTVNASGVQSPEGYSGTGSASDTWTMLNTAPTITDVVDVTPDPRNLSVSAVDVVFSEPINLATFTFADMALTRDGSAVTLTGEVTTSLVSGSTYRINGLAGFTPSEGTYVITVNTAGVEDLYGNTGTGSDSDAWVMDTTKPRVTDIVDVTPDPRNGAVGSVDVVFSEPINLATFAFNDLTLTRNGNSVSLTSAVTTAFVSGATYRISGLGAFTGATGTYALTVRTVFIADPAGNEGTNTDSASDDWVNTSSLVVSDIIDVSPDPRNTAVSAVNVVFSAPIELSTFTFADLVLTRNGTVVSLTSAVTTQLVSGSTYQVGGLDAFTGPAGTYVLTVNGSGVRDSGNTAVAGSVSDTWVTDTAAPAAPVVTGVSSDTGAADGITNDQTLIVSGTVEPNSTVTVLRDGAVVGTASANGSGAWSFDHTAATLGAGSYAFRARATDAAGNTGPDSAAFIVIVDVTPPAAPAVTGVSTDTGAADGVTTDQTLVISGTSEPNSTVTVFRDAAVIGSAAANGSGAWSFDHTGVTLAYGAYAFTAKATDVAGNTGPVSSPYNVTVVSTQGPAVTLSASAVFAEDGGTATVTATLSGVAALPVTVTLGFGGTATFGDDYTRSAASVTIPAGQTSGSVTLTGVTDSLTEGTQAVVVDVTAVTNGTESGTQQAVILLRDVVAGSPQLVAETFFGGSGDEDAAGVAVDAGSNRVFVAGGSAANGGDGFLARYTVTPATDGVSEDWSLAFPEAAGPDRLQGVATAGGAAYVAGLSDALTADPLGGKEYKGVTAKFPAAGVSPSWVTQTPASPGATGYGGFESLTGVTTAVEGGQTYLYVTGAAQSGLGDGGRLFVSKLTAAGGVVWTWNDVPATVNSGGARVVAAGGGIYVAGHTYDGGGGPHAMLSRFDSDGNIIWSWAPTVGSFAGLAVDAAGGAVYSVGTTSGANRDVLIEKWDLDGNRVWSKPYDLGSAADGLTGAALVNGRLYAVGSTTGGTAGGADGLLLEIDQATGDLLDASLWGGGGNDSFTDVAATATHLHIVGSTRSFGAGGSDAVHTLWRLPGAANDSTAPTASVGAVSPSPRNTAVGQLTVTFSEPVTGLGLSDLRLKRDGVAIDLSASALTTADGVTWTLGNLSGLTTAGGAYTLTLPAAGSGIQDAGGNALPADVAVSWVADTTAPTGQIGAVAGPRTTPVGSMTVTFSEAVTGFDRNDLTLKRDGGANLLTAAQTLTSADGKTWTLGNLTGLTGLNGTYTLTLGSGVQDQAGNTLASGAQESWVRANTAPTLTLPAGTADHTEDGPATFLAVGGTAADDGSPDFDGGTLTVRLTQGGTTADRLEIRNEGTGAGQVGVSGVTVTYGGAPVATLAGGTGAASSLVVTFSGPVGAAIVQAVLRNLVFRVSSNAPSTADRTAEVTLTDGDGGTGGPATVTVRVTATNDGPTATLPATFATAEDTPVKLTGLAVADPDAGTKDVRVTLSSTAGTLTLAAGVSGGLTAGQIDGNGGSSVTVTAPIGAINTTLAYAAGLTYLPASDAHGQVTLTLSVNDSGNTGSGGPLSADSTSVITVTAVNDAPLASPQEVTVAEDAIVTVTLAGSDPEGDPLTYVVVRGPDHGTLGGAGSDRTYTPDPDYNGPDSFTVRVNDGNLDSPEAIVSLTVTPVNDSPAAEDGSGTTLEDLALNGTLPGTDVDGDPLAFAIMSGPAHGQLTAFNPFNGAFTYAPDADFHGQDAFAYQVTDGSGAHAEGTFRVTVFPVNDAPVATGGTLTTNEDTANTGSVAATDVDGDAFTYAVVSQPAHGVLSLNPTTGAYTYTPNLNYNGPDSFTFKANDGTTDSNTATVTISVTPVNDAPVAVDGSSTTAEDTAKTGFASATDTEEDTLTYAVVAQPAHGSLALNPTTGAYTYTPEPNYNGPDSFTFQANDGTAISDTATVTIAVTPVNDAPVAADGTLTTSEDTSETGSVSATDAEGNTLTYAVATPPAHGTLTALNSATGAYTYTPVGDYFGPDSFTFKARDAFGDSNVATVTITVDPVNDAPVATDGTLTTNEDTPKTGTLAATEVDSATLTYSVVTQPVHGFVTVTNPATGAYTYSPDLNYNGPDPFTFKAFDGTDNSNTATITVTVTAVPDAPVATDDTLTTDEDTAKAGTLPATDADAAATLTYTIVDQPTHGTLTSINPATGAYTYSPNLNYNGPDSFTFTANDGTADSNLGAVSVTVNPVNDAPLAANGNLTAVEDTLTNGSMVSSDGDVGSTRTFSVVDSPLHGTVNITIPATGAYTYTPDLNYNGPDSFTFIVNDGTVDSNLATVNVTVAAVNDTPTLDDITSPAAILEDAGVKTIGLAGISAGPPDEQAVQSVTVTATSGNTALIANGSLSFTGSGDTRTLSYTPTANASGTAVITVRVQDDSSPATFIEKTFTVTVDPVNDLPVATDGSLSTAEDTAKAGTLGATDTEGNALTFAVIDEPAHGTVTITDQATGAYTYTPALNYNGPDSFTFTASDVGGVSNVATVTLNLTPVNDLPVATGASVTTAEDTAKSGTLSAADADLDAVTYAVTQPAHGSVTVTPGTGAYTYTPAADFSGPDAFTFTASDVAGASNVATVTVTVTAVNDLPVAAGRSLSTPEDTAANAMLSATDEEGDALTYVVVTQPAHGAVVITNPATGAYTYTAPPDYSGPDSFTFTASDAGGASNVATVTITVGGINDRPVIDTSFGIAIDRIPAKTLDPAGVPISALVAHVMDADGTTAGVAITAAPSSSETGKWQFKLTGAAATWTDVGAVSDASALLLSDATARVRFLPSVKPSAKKDFSGIVTLTFKAWDGSDGGTPGSKVTTLAGTAFSTTKETAVVAVGKTSPVIDAGGRPAFTTVAKDDANPAGNTVKTLIGGLVTDSNDAAAKIGIAVTAAASANGTWEYKAGKVWVAITGMSDTSALLLGPATVVRFRPNAGFAGEATLTYRAWDGRAGVIGRRAAVSLSGISATAQTAAVTVGLPALDTTKVQVLATPASTVAVSALVAGAVTDIPLGDAVGIAVTKVTGKGVWNYKIGAAGTLTPIKGVAATKALLLPGNAILSYAAKTGEKGVAALSYQAWDITAQPATTLPTAAGTFANTTDKKATIKPFSAATETLSVFVGTNLPPSLTAASFAIGSIIEDVTANDNKGVAVLAVAKAAGAADTDKNLVGVAITTTTGLGTWEYSLDAGKTWKAIGAVSVTNSLLLAPAAKVRFAPAAEQSGAATLTLRAWDGTYAASGDYADPATAGQTAFGVVSAVGTLTVTPVNDLPVLETAPLQYLRAATATVSTTAKIGDLTAGLVTDADSPPVTSFGVVVTAKTGDGTWEVSPDGIAAFGPLPKLPATLLATDVIRFTATAGFVGVASLTYKAVDADGGQSEAVEMLTVSFGTTPTVLAAAGTLKTITEDQKVIAGDAVTALLPAQSKLGVAVTGVTGAANGEWQYSTDGGKKWKAIGAVSPTSALLLTGVNKVRFVPAKDYFSTPGAEPALTYAAWDLTVGAGGEKVDTTTAGLTAFSAAVTAKVTVTSVADAPTLDTSGMLVIAAGPAGGPISGFLTGTVSDPEGGAFGIAVTGLTGTGTWSYKIGAGDVVPITSVSAGKALLLPATATLSFIPASGFSGTATLKYKAWDTAFGAHSTTAATTGANAAFFSVADETLFVVVENSQPVLTDL